MECALLIWVTWLAATGEVAGYDLMFDDVMQPRTTDTTIQVCVNDPDRSKSHQMTLYAIGTDGSISEPSINQGTIAEMWHPDAAPPTPTVTPTSSPTSTPVATPSYCVACGLDANRDGVVGFKDFGELLGKYGTCVDHEQQVEVPCE
jgi:hypothetical protein